MVNVYSAFSVLFALHFAGSTWLLLNLTTLAPQSVTRRAHRAKQNMKILSVMTMFASSWSIPHMRYGRGFAFNSASL